MGPKEIFAGVSFALLATGGSSMMQLGPSLFPGQEKLIFAIGALLVLFAAIGLLYLLFEGKITALKFGQSFAVLTAWRPVLKALAVMLLVYGGAFGIGYWLASSSSPLSPDPPVITGIPAERIAGYYRDRTNVEANLLVQPFVGPAVTVTGVVDDVYAMTDGPATVYLAGPFASPRIRMTFEGDEFHLAARLAKGDTVATRCEFKGDADPIGLRFENCQFL